jgi:hypothetical protein
VIQYIDFAWPSYHEQFTLVNQTPVTSSEPNPASARLSLAVLWIDIGKRSKAMRLELKEAQSLQIPVVRVSPASVDSMDSNILSPPAVVFRVSSIELPESVAREILRLLRLGRRDDEVAPAVE